MQVKCHLPFGPSAGDWGSAAFWADPPCPLKLPAHGRGRAACRRVRCSWEPRRFLPEPQGRAGLRIPESRRSLAPPARTCGCQGRCNQLRAPPAPWAAHACFPCGWFRAQSRPELSVFLPWRRGARFRGGAASGWLEGRLGGSLISGEKETVCRGSGHFTSQAVPASWDSWGTRSTPQSSPGRPSSKP